jgi:hypothetical protein
MQRRVEGTILGPAPLVVNKPTAYHDQRLAEARFTARLAKLQLRADAALKAADAEEAKTRWARLVVHCEAEGSRPIIDRRFATSFVTVLCPLFLALVIGPPLF